MTVLFTRTCHTRNQMLIEKFSALADRFSIIKCYENKLFYNCSYSKEVEEVIKKIEDKIIESENIPWWIDLID